MGQINICGFGCACEVLVSAYASHPCGWLRLPLLSRVCLFHIICTVVCIKLPRIGGTVRIIRPPQSRARIWYITSSKVHIQYRVHTLLSRGLWVTGYGSELLVMHENYT